MGMTVLRLLRRWFTFAWRRREWERDLDEEMQFHIAMRERRGAEAGASDDEAQIRAARRFGNTRALRERSREAWIAPCGS